MSLLRSVLEHFVLPSGSPRPAAHEDFVPPDEGPDRACAEPAPRTPSGVAAPPAPSDGELPPFPSAVAMPPGPSGLGLPRTPSGVAVLCTAGDAPSLGAALGLALARRCRAPVVAVCVWTAGAPAQAGWRAPATPGTRRLAAAFAARGLAARAAGRLALVHLPAAAEDAAVGARRATAAAGAAPTVLALGGPRVAAFDALLAEQDLVVVASPRGTDPALARLALAGLEPVVARACVCEVPGSHPARVLATSGLTLLPSARRALAGPVEALS